MIEQPFAVFTPHAARIRVALLTKTDAVATDADIGATLKASNIASLHQVHGGACVIVREPTQRTLQADAFATDTPGLTLTIRAADCQIFVLYAPKKGRIALVHAGWKGLLAGVLPHTVATLQSTWDIDPAELLAGAGPSLCTTCAEFTDPHRELPGIDARFFHGRCADLRGIADAQLCTAGIDPAHLERLPGCTRCSPEAYWTYRGGDREAVLAGHTNVLACTLLG